MNRTIVFVNQKGGVGKTTSAVNIGAYLAEAGKNVLLVDFDSQANLSSGLGIKSKKNGIYEVIAGKIPVEKAVQKTVCDNLFVIPASMDLSGATVELINENRYDQFLKKALSPLVNKFGFILIDCPPSLGVLTLNGLAAANGVLIPMQCEYFALEGLSMLLQTIKRIQLSINPTLTIDGIFFTMYDQRTRLAQQVVKHVTAYFKDRVFSTIIPRNVRLSEAPSHRLPISKYDAGCAGALAYKSLTQELLLHAEGKYGGN
ncbi:MAG: ParA family protein [Spirochaetaceae bacterium]|jgi:chromosome partitioning protein|nr:ParA family protein [Spirochaetaceae bacterium]